MKVRSFKIAMVATLSAVCGCSSSTNSGPDPLPPYVGTWEAGCSESRDSVREKLQLPLAYEIKTHGFNLNTHSSRWEIFSTTDCSEDSLVLEVGYGEEFTEGTIVDSATGTRSIDLEVDDIAAFLLTSSLVTHANTTKLCGGGWVESTIDRSATHRKELENLQCLGVDDLVISGQTIYSSYKIENDTLILAVSSADSDGSSEGKRMTQLGTQIFKKK